MRSVWQSITCIKNHFSLLNWTWVCLGGSDLSKEVLWVSAGQLALKLQAFKIGDLQKIRPSGPPRTTRVRPGFDSQTIGSSSNFDSLYLCSQLTYRDPQYLFGKIWTSLTYIVSIKRTSRIFNIDYALSKWPHLHRAYVIRGCIFLWLAVPAIYHKNWWFFFEVRHKRITSYCFNT